MSSITPGTKGFVHYPKASSLSHVYRPVIVTEAEDHLIWVAPDEADKDPHAEPHAVYERSRTLVGKSTQFLYLEGEEGYDIGAKWWEYDRLRAETAAIVRRWTYDQTNPGLALQASEALRVLASTPEPPKD